MRDGWLGKDPSTALEDGDFAMAAKMSEWVCVCVRYVSVEKHKAAKGPSRGDSWGEIKAAGSYHRDKCRSVEPDSIMHQNSCRLLHLPTICYWAKTTEGSVVSHCSFMWRTMTEQMFYSSLVVMGTKFSILLPKTHCFPH